MDPSGRIGEQPPTSCGLGRLLNCDACDALKFFQGERAVAICKAACLFIEGVTGPLTTCDPLDIGEKIVDVTPTFLALSQRLMPLSGQGLPPFVIDGQLLTLLGLTGNSGSFGLIVSGDYQIPPVVGVDFSGGVALMVNQDLSDCGLYLSPGAGVGVSSDVFFEGMLKLAVPDIVAVGGAASTASIDGLPGFGADISFDLPGIAANVSVSDSCDVTLSGGFTGLFPSISLARTFTFGFTFCEALYNRIAEWLSETVLE